MRNTHPALSPRTKTEIVRRPVHVTNFRANATLPDKKSQRPLRMPGAFFVLYMGKVPRLTGKTDRPNKPNRRNPKNTPPPAKTETARTPTPEISASRQLPGMKFVISETRPTPLRPIRKPRPPRRPANRIITPAWGPARHTNARQRDTRKILSKNDKYFLIFKICSYICRRNDPKTKHQRLWIYSQ